MWLHIDPLVYRFPDHIYTLGYTARLQCSHWHSIFHFEFPSFQHVHELSRRKTCHFE